MNEPASNAARALVVAAEAAVRDDMVKSLRAVRVEAISTDHIDGCVAEISSSTSLVLLYPDGFRFDQVVGILFALRRERPEVHAVIVTEKPERFARLVVAADNAPTPSIIPMPAPAWTILEVACAAVKQTRVSSDADELARGQLSRATLAPRAPEMSK